MELRAPGAGPMRERVQSHQRAARAMVGRRRAFHPAGALAGTLQHLVVIIRRNRTVGKQRRRCAFNRATDTASSIEPTITRYIAVVKSCRQFARTELFCLCLSQFYSSSAFFRKCLIIERFGTAHQNEPVTLDGFAIDARSVVVEHARCRQGPPSIFIMVGHVAFVRLAMTRIANPLRNEPLRHEMRRHLELITEPGRARTREHFAVEAEHLAVTQCPFGRRAG